jgi:CSLREA domain-containing protein
VSDEDIPDGHCSLREAIITANAAGGVKNDCGQGTGFDEIDFSVSGKVVISSALGTFPAIRNDLIIDGTGQTVAIDGGHGFQVFAVNAGATFELNDLTIQNGSNGGGEGTGGGIANCGTLTVNNSTISDNVADSGGGIFNNACNGVNVTLTVTNSTISGNVGALGGGGIQNGGTATLTNITVSGNSSMRDGGGGVYNAGTLTVVNSTIAGNSAPGPRGGGLINFGSAMFKNTIMANNSSGGNCSDFMMDINPVTSQGRNLQDDMTCAFLHVGDINDVPAGLDPAGLKDNGGPTQTIALLPTSPAVDSVPIADCPSTDQRGNPRPDPEDSDLANAACDIGAYESSDPSPTPTPTPTRTPTPTPTVTPTPVAEKMVVAGSGNFGTVVDGRTKTRSYRIKNVGSKKTGHSVTISSESIKDTTAMASPFSLLSMCAQVLVPGQSCGVAVKCAPTDSDTSTHTAVLDVFDNAAGSPQTVNLACTAKAPRGKAADEENIDSEGVVQPEEAPPPDE